MANNTETQKSGLCTAGLVLGILGVCTSIIPIINNLSFLMGILAVIFGLVSIKKSSKGKMIATVILGILAIAITLNVQKATSDALNEVSANLDKASGNSTEAVLANDVNVELGTFEATEGAYGITETKLPVKVTNKTNEKKSFTIQVEATDSEGNRINQDYIYANNLTAGQSQNFDIFQYVESDKIDTMKNATFKIVEASVY
ncbi:MAG: DUF4190 domain-containing protein [Clostridia bacterium]